jgi:hypothetical protein
MWVIPEDLGNFSPKKGEKSWGAKIHVFRRWIFTNRQNLMFLNLSNTQQKKLKFQGYQTLLFFSLALAVVEFLTNLWIFGNVEMIITKPHKSWKIMSNNNNFWTTEGTKIANSIL